MSRNRKIYDDDDGRTIANMNVEGMPWYDRRERREARARARGGGSFEVDRKDRKFIILGILAACAVVTVIFAAIFLLVILGISAVGH